MARETRIPADGPKDTAPTKKSLAAEVQSASAAKQKLREKRQKIRKTKPKAEAKAALAKLDDEYNAAVEAVNDAEKRYWRFTNGEGTAPQRVKLGTAKEGEVASSG